MNSLNKFAILLIATTLTSGLLAGSGSAAFSGEALVGDKGQPLYEVVTMAGTGDYGSKEDLRLQAEFRHPSGLLALADGSVIASDENNHLLRVITDREVKSFAGVLLAKDEQGLPEGGLLDGPSDRALFHDPAGLAQDAAGNLYVADSGNHAVRKVDTAGNVATIAGNGLLGKLDGSGGKATFNTPRDVAVAKDGTVYVADTMNHLIRRISPDGVVSTLNAASDRVVEAFPGLAVPSGDFADGKLAQAKFNEPTGLALDALGNLYVSDTGNQSIRYIDFASGTVSTVAGAARSLKPGATVYADGTELYVRGGFADGEASKARFHAPAGIAVTDEGGLLIADSLNHSVRYLLDGKVSTLAGHAAQLSGDADGADRIASLQRPTDVAALPGGALYVSDAHNNKIKLVVPYRLPELPALSATDDVRVVLNSRIVSFDAKPEIVSGRTMVPVRAVAELLGYEVEYDAGKRLAIFTDKDGNRIELLIEASSPYVPYLKHDRAYVPVRFMAEQLGLDVQWNAEKRAVILRT